MKTALTALVALALSAPQEHELRAWKKIVLTEEFTCEGAAAGDFNKDGVQDVAVGPWWYAGPDFQKKTEFYPVTIYKKDNQYSNNFFTFTGDFNKDGWTDVLVYGFPGKDASWFENPQGKEGHWPRHEIFPVVDNESPTFTDINGDQAPDIVCSTGGHYGYVTVADKKFHPISPKGPWQKFTHGLGVGDVNGDGRMDLLEKDGWWEQPASLEGDPVWKKHDVKFGRGGAQMYAYDVDGDGLNDVITSIEAHGYGLSWFQQKKADGKAEWKEHVVVGRKEDDNRYGVKFTQMHAIDLVDIDGDGLKDIVTGKRHFAHGSKGDPEPLADPVLYWFKLVRGEGGAHYVPYRIDDQSGVGTQVVATDLNGDGRPDIVVGCKMGGFVHLQEVRKVSRDEWEKAQPKPRQ